MRPRALPVLASRRGSALLLPLLPWLLLTVAPPGAAQPLTAAPAPSSSPSVAATGDLELAKELFRQGVALFEAGDIERALDFFMRSRAAFPSAKNTLNAAICLEKLGRADEAIELYEEVITKHAEGLDPNARAGIVSATAALRKKVGNIDVSANVEGMLVIDGRMRGKLPLLSPVRVMPGAHVVRVIKDGWETFQQSVKVEVGQTVAIDAKLAPLTTSGRLRVDGLEGATVFVDGAAVGSVPWEGTLSPGAHLCFVQKDDRGSDPRVVNVIKGQTTAFHADPQPLGVPVLVVVEPSTAQLSVDGVVLGTGRWQGRLTVGEHTFTAREEGWVTRTLVVTSGPKAFGEQVLRLAVDRDHPRWAIAQRGKYLVELSGGPVFGGGFGSDAESCARCSVAESTLGAFATVRGGYELPAKISVLLGVGWLSVARAIDRELSSSFPGPSGPVPVTWSLHDRLRLSGLLATAGAGYRVSFGVFEIGARLSVGVGLLGARDAITGTATANGRSVPVDIEASGKTVRGVAVFGIPELFGALRFGAFDVRLGVTALASLASGPRLDTGQMRVSGAACSPGEVECAPGNRLVAAERAFGRLVLLIPEIGVGWAF